MRIDITAEKQYFSNRMGFGAIPGGLHVVAESS